jgi:predicted nucleic acid-binding protein
MVLAPNNAQRTRFAKAAGVARFAYSWTLAVWRRMRGAWKADRKLRLYLDTTIPSYLFVKGWQDGSEAARLVWERHETTRRLWERCVAGEYRVSLSDIFFEELKRCPQPKLGKIQEQLDMVAFDRLHDSLEARGLAAEYIRRGVLEEKDFNDCLHIAYAVVNGCDMILSWNFRHIVNDLTRGKVRVVNSISRYNEIGIVSPDDFLMGRP